MFQYSCAYAVAKRNNAKLTISTCDGHAGQSTNQLVDTFRLADVVYDDYREISFQFQESSFCYDSRIENVLDGTDLVGYFQSDRYFKHVRDELLEKQFIFNDNILQHVSKCRDFLDLNRYESSCSIHIRAGDYTKLSNVHTNLKEDYYTRALAQTPECDVYLVFSDELHTAKKILERAGLEKQYRFVYPDLDYGTSLCMMSTCDSHIIANSSFSWWGAWLSNSSKSIIAPGQWFGPQGPKEWHDIYCSGWKIV
jgi:hypothetical protein